MFYITLAEAFASIIHLENNFLVKKLTSETANKIEGTIILFGSFARGERYRSLRHLREKS